MERVTENTLFKVRNALLRVGLTEQQITDAINEMQNEGILFRERGKVAMDMHHPVHHMTTEYRADVAEMVRDELVKLSKRHPRPSA